MSKLFNIDHIKFLCQKYGLRPSKKYGQNFLINEEIIEKIIESADIKKADTVVEIGPGFGSLTFALSERAKKVIAFEIEKRLLDYWSDKKPSNMEIHWGNALKHLDYMPDKKYKVVANLPYQITSLVIRAFLEADNAPTQMVLMVQKEVAERICAKPGDMSVLSVATQYYALPKIVTNVSRSNFWPEPKVDSAIIQLDLKKDQSPTAESVRFFQLVKAGFANRRKLLIKNLESIIGKKNKQKIKEAFVKMNIKETARAQELNVEQWIFLAKEL